MSKPLARSDQLGSALLYKAMTILKDQPEGMRGSELLDLLPQHVTLDDWAKEVIESNGLPRWRTFALFYSVDQVKAGFLQKNQGVWTLTTTGGQALKLGERAFFDAAKTGYRRWKREQLVAAGASAGDRVESETEESLPPEVKFDLLRKDVNTSLAAEILEQVKANSWQFFERLVVALLLAMNYGGSAGSGMAFERGSDGGVDGFINQDKLGLDVVYVQAKRWADQTVGRPDIQQFVGALAGRQASRGVFITTSRFSAEAREYVKSLNVRVILIDGEHLAQLMIEHGVGVSTWKKFELKRIDSDFFAEE